MYHREQMYLWFGLQHCYKWMGHLNNPCYLIYLCGRFPVMSFQHLGGIQCQLFKKFKLTWGLIHICTSLFSVSEDRLEMSPESKNLIKTEPLAKEWTNFRTIWVVYLISSKSKSLHFYIYFIYTHTPSYGSTSMSLFHYQI